MTFKARIRPLLPRPLLRLYNRVISRRIIRGNLGSWFDMEWKRRGPAADDRTWVETYDDSWRHWTQPDLSPEDIGRILQLLPRGCAVLDAGCGDGHLLEHLEEIASMRAGVDLSREGLHRARGRLGADVHLVQAFLESLPFADGSFDVVVSAHTLEHVRGFDRAVAELVRVARKRVILLVPCQEYKPYTEDYHLHFFPTEEEFIKRIGLPGAVCRRYTIPPGVCAYQGDVLLFTAELADSRDATG